MVRKQAASQAGNLASSRHQSMGRGLNVELGRRSAAAAVVVLVVLAVVLVCAALGLVVGAMRVVSE